MAVVEVMAAEAFTAEAAVRMVEAAAPVYPTVVAVASTVVAAAIMGAAVPMRRPAAVTAAPPGAASTAEVITGRRVITAVVRTPDAPSQPV